MLQSSAGFCLLRPGASKAILCQSLIWASSVLQHNKRMGPDALHKTCCSAGWRDATWRCAQIYVLQSKETGGSMSFLLVILLQEASDSA